MSKDTVKKRIEDPTKSISYTEFSYMLLQGYDFCHLFKNMGVKLQIGGQDQWGNLVTGTELIRKKYEQETFVMTWPLIVDSTGKKFGKSEGNALFLDKEKTSSYKMYQYFMNTPDSDVARYLKMLTLLETEEIDALVADHLENPAERKGQKTLAFKVVEIIHSTADAQTAEKISELLFGKEDKCELLKNLNTQEISDVFAELGGFAFAGENLFESIVKAGLAESNSQAREAVKSGAIFIQEKQIEDFNYDLSGDFFENGIILIRKGKKNFRIIKK
jgi:tyrosyl-tRNA synthetase